MPSPSSSAYKKTQSCGGLGIELISNSGSSTHPSTTLTPSTLLTSLIKYFTLKRRNCATKTLLDSTIYVVNLNALEYNLKLRTELPYIWGSKQNDEDDIRTNFIYSTRSFPALKNKLENLPGGLQNYALNRWLNFWSAQGIEQIFAENPLVEPNPNKKSKLWDFFISGVEFDHKTTVFPKSYPNSFEKAKSDPQSLISWLYNNQSQFGRKHFNNRLFVVLCGGDSWKLKAEIGLIRQEINNYLKNFSVDNLQKLNLAGKEVFSDIIWIEK